MYVVLIFLTNMHSTVCVLNLATDCHCIRSQWFFALSDSNNTRDYFIFPSRHSFIVFAAGFVFLIDL